MKTEQKKKIDQAVDLLMPEAEEIVKRAMEQKTTKHGYGYVMATFAKINDRVVSQILLMAMVKAGYPAETANQLREIMGWSIK